MQTEPIITNAEDTRRAASAGVDLWLEIDGRRFHRVLTGTPPGVTLGRKPPV